MKSKKLIAVFLVLALAAVFAACGRPAEPDVTLTTVPSQEDTTGETLSDNETAVPAETDTAAEETTEEETTEEETTQAAEDKILVEYYELVSGGEYRISLICTAEGEYMLSTGKGDCPAEAGAYTECLNTFYSYGMSGCASEGGNCGVRILLDDGSYATVTNRDPSANSAFAGIRNILTAFDENAPAPEAPEDAAG